MNLEFQKEKEAAFHEDLKATLSSFMILHVLKVLQVCPGDQSTYLLLQSSTHTEPATSQGVHSCKNYANGKPARSCTWTCNNHLHRFTEHVLGKTQKEEEQVWEKQGSGNVKANATNEDVCMFQADALRSTAHQRHPDYINTYKEWAISCHFHVQTPNCL